MARDLSDFLELTERDAAAQWRQICRRSRPAPGHRQEDFLPVEVLLCHGLLSVVSPHRFGGANIHTVPAELASLAATFRRSAGSLTSKMLNLEGARLHGGKHEVLLSARLTVDRSLFAGLYGRILRAARSAGFTEAEVPDFLGGLDSQADTLLLGQDEIGPEELLLAVSESGRALSECGLGGEETERVVEQSVRIGQHRFARAVLGAFDHRCGFCGFAPGPLEGRRLLLASHVKPWRDSTPHERLDPRNGIAACPAHDAAFDVGLLTVNGGRRIHRSANLEGLIVRDAGANRFFGVGALAAKLILPPRAAGPAPCYLDYHRQHVFAGN
ncbi:MAG: HNH endonuclease [Planctomycetes bacterium]|nr:HNH endonuclease [Planctomycetota bacterium]